MSWFTKILRGKAQDTGVNASGWETLLGLGEPWALADTIWKSYSKAQLEDAYKKHALIFACVREIATSIAEPRPEVGMETPDGWQALEKSDTLDLLMQPNEWYSYNDLIQAWVSRLLLTGKSFIWKWRNRGRGISELWPIPSQWVTVKTGTTGNILVDHYDVNQGKGQVLKVEPNEMFFARFVDTSTVWDGVGPLQAAIHDYQLDVERENYLVEMLTNLKVPGLTLKQERTDVPLTPQQKADLRHSLHEIAGHGKRGGVPILPPGISMEFPGLLKDMDWPKFTTLTESRICAAFGVPPIIIGVRAGLEHATYANYATARKSFYTETLGPLWASLGGTLTRGLLRNEGEMRLEIRFNLKHISELQEDLNKRAERMAMLLKSGAVTRNEVRAALGLESVADGEVYLLPINIIEQPQRTRPPKETESGKLTKRIKSPAEA